MHVAVFFLRCHIVVVLQTGLAEHSTGRIEKTLLRKTALRLGYIQVAAVEQHHIVQGGDAEAAQLHIIAAVRAVFVEIERNMRLKPGEGDL